MPSLCCGTENHGPHHKPKGSFKTMLCAHCVSVVCLTEMAHSRKFTPRQSSRISHVLVIRYRGITTTVYWFCCSPYADRWCRNISNTLLSSVTPDFSDVRFIDAKMLTPQSLKIYIVSGLLRVLSSVSHSTACAQHKFKS